MTGKTTESALRDQVRTLGEKFLQRTAGQIAQLQAELARVAETGDRDALRTFQEIVHKIHGSGAMFGFNRVSDLAGALEELALGHDNQSAAGGPESAAQLASQMRPILEQLTEAVTAAIAQPVPVT